MDMDFDDDDPVGVSIGAGAPEAISRGGLDLESDVAVTESSGSGGNSEDLFTLFSQRIMHQFSREKYTMEQEIRARYERQFEVRKRNLMEELKIKQDQFESSVRLQYQQKLEQKRLESERRLQEFEKAVLEKFTRQTESNDGKWLAEIEQLKGLYTGQLEKKELSHRAQLEEVRKEHYAASQGQRREFEESTKRESEARMREYKKKVTEMLVQRERELEAERSKLKGEKMEFETAVHKKYHELMTKKDQDVKVLLTARENELLNYDHEKNVKMQQMLQEREAERVQEELRRHQQYERQLGEVKQAAQRRIEQAAAESTRLADERDGSGERCTRLELQITRMKQNLDTWKLAYHKSTMNKFKRLIFEVELNSKREMEDFARRQIQDYENHLLLELKQKDQELRMYEKREKDFKMQLIESQRSRRTEDVSYKSKEQGFRKLQKYRVRIVELWEALEVPSGERFKFTWNCHSFNNFTTDTILYFKNEIQRLTEKLPLMETIKRREFIKKRIKEMFHSGAGAIDEVKLGEMNLELKRLNDILLTNLPVYERKYSEVFALKGGQSYLKTMNKENRFFAI